MRFAYVAAGAVVLGASVTEARSVNSSPQASEKLPKRQQGPPIVPFSLGSPFKKKTRSVSSKTSAQAEKLIDACPSTKKAVSRAQSSHQVEETTQHIEDLSAIQTPKNQTIPQRDISNINALPIPGMIAVYPQDLISSDYPQAYNGLSRGRKPSVDSFDGFEPSGKSAINSPLHHTTPVMVPNSQKSTDNQRQTAHGQFPDLSSPTTYEGKVTRKAFKTPETPTAALLRAIKAYSESMSTRRVQPVSPDSPSPPGGMKPYSNPMLLDSSDHNSPNSPMSAEEDDLPNSPTPFRTVKKVYNGSRRMQKPIPFGKIQAPSINFINKKRIHSAPQRQVNLPHNNNETSNKAPFQISNGTFVLENSTAIVANPESHTLGNETLSSNQTHSFDRAIMSANQSQESGSNATVGMTNGTAFNSTSSNLTVPNPQNSTQ
ncbi:hypothetical protein O181_062319 [Austropuccinia psidii MF-1]|uniref:Uncharacterized protein n=1 Tax=Austropuccinia psidii MF-1 TaxID=1389203 RepID=A0A9Q3EK53_9BASI|nr:hypothetical protein [Austropuccinia psidii MF-1]